MVCGQACKASGMQAQRGLPRNQTYISPADAAKWWAGRREAGHSASTGASNLK